MFRNTYSFDDILLVPRYSNLESRSLCDVSMDTYNLPIITSPMDTVTTPGMIKYFINNNLMAVVHRYFQSAEEQYDYISSIGEGYVHSVFFAVGSIKKHKEWIDYLLDKNIRYFCIDMAHGDSQLCVDTIKYIKDKSSVSKIIAGNVVTKSGFGRLQDVGADYIRVGIGCGCFTPEMLINTENGYIPIKDIKNGIKVYTHDGTLQTVINTMSYIVDKEIYKINDIECTDNHEFYVIHRNDEDKVTEENIQLYAKWVKASDLTEEWLLIETFNENKKDKEK